MLKDELLGLAADPHADQVFRNQHINMDVLYRTGETQRVRDIFYYIIIKGVVLKVEYLFLYKQRFRFLRICIFQVICAYVTLYFANGGCVFSENIPCYRIYYSEFT